MYKRIILILLMTVVVGSATLFAVSLEDIRFKSAISLNTGEANIGLGVFDGSFGYSVAVNGDVAGLFDNGFGPYAKLSLDIPGSAFGITLGGAYELPTKRPDMFLMFTAGPTFRFVSGYFTFGMDVLAHFEWVALSKFYVRISSGLQMEFVSTMKGFGTVGGFGLYVPLPVIAVGYRF
jgi:hypothetical protein